MLVGACEGGDILGNPPRSAGFTVGTQVGPRVEPWVGIGVEFTDGQMSKHTHIKSNIPTNELCLVAAGGVLIDLKMLVLGSVGGIITVAIAASELPFTATALASIRGCGGDISIKFPSVGCTVETRVETRVEIRIGFTDGSAPGGMLVLVVCEEGGILGNPQLSQYTSVRVRL